MASSKRSSHQTHLEQQYYRIRKELAAGIGLLGLLFCIGTLWYRWVEGWHWVEAAYMTMITLSTVGFGEIQPLGDRGRIFTMGLILLGLLSIGYIVNRFTEALIQGHFQQSMRRQRQRKQMAELLGHHIICGFGRMGRQVAAEFQAEGVPFIVSDMEAEAIQWAEEMGYTAIQGDATLDTTLLKLGVERANCLIAALPSDAENLYIVISAKTLNPQIRAIVRASNEEAQKKLLRAGADAVISPYITGGRRMAAAALRPQVMDFVDGILMGTDRTFYMEEFHVEPAHCPHVGETLREAKLRSQSGALVLAIRRSNGELISGPDADTLLMSSDRLICMGTPEQLRRLNQILCPRPFRSPRPSHRG